MNAAPPLIELEGVGIALGGRPILSDLKWSLRRGECAVVLGPSGSGKSVFLSILLGLRRADSGRIGRPGIEGEFFDQVAVLFQEDALLDDRSVEANLAVARLERADVRAGPFDHETEQAIERVLVDVDLDPKAVRRSAPSGLSGGQRRRVALARALIREPSVLIADEPTSGLDPATSRAIYELMADLIRRKGMSAVIISHDPECAAALGDPVYYFTPLAGELARMEASGEGERPSRGSILEWVERTKAQAPPPPERKPPVAPPPDESEWTRYKRAVLEGIDGLGAAVLFFRHLAALPSAAMLLRNLRLWGLESAGLVALIFALLGFVLQIQGESALVDFGFSNRLPEFQALALVRLAPFLAAILMAGRCGSAIAAQAGWQALSGQRRALMTMRIDPDRVFFPALFWSWALVLPVLTAIGMLAAWSGALLYLVSPLSSADLTVQAFINGLPRELETAALVGAAIKSAIMAGGLAAIAYGGGSRAEGSIAQVMGAITGGLVLSFVWISLVDTGLSLVFQS